LGDARSLYLYRDGLTAGTSLFLQDLVTAAGFGTVPPILLFAVVSLVVWLFAVRDIRISSRLGLTVEVISVSIILLICVISLQDHGFALDTKQLKLEVPASVRSRRPSCSASSATLASKALRPSARKPETRTSLYRAPSS